MIHLRAIYIRNQIIRDDVSLHADQDLRTPQPYRSEGLTRSLHREFVNGALCYSGQML